MAEPKKYTRGYSFSGWQANNPSKPLPGQKVDVELDNIGRATNEAIDALALIQRSDGKLNNGIVTVESLAPGVAVGFTMRGLWTPDTLYFAGDGVGYNGAVYRANTVHASEAGQTPVLRPDLWTRIDQMSALGPIADQPTAEAGVDNSQLMSALRTLQSIIANAKDGVIPAPGLYAQPRSIEATLADFVDVKKYGVSAANSSEQNRIGMQKALDENTHLIISEVVRLDQPLTQSNRLMNMYGYGANGCGLVFEDCPGLQVDMSGISDIRVPTRIDGVSIRTTAAGLYDGITYTGRRGVQYSQQLLVDAVTISGVQDDANARWRRGASLVDAGQSEFSRYTIAGGSPTARTQAGIHLEGSKIVRLTHGEVFNCDDAYAATNDTEGVTLVDNTVLSCVNGLVSYNNVGNQFTVQGGHFAVAVAAVVLAADRNGGTNSGSNHSAISNTFTLVFDGLPDHTADDFIGFDIGSTDVIIANNNLARTTATKNRYGVRLRSVAGRPVPNSVIVLNNNFNAFTKGAILDLGVTNSLLGPNKGINSRASMYEDNSGQNSNRFVYADSTGFGHHAQQHDFLSRDSGAGGANPIARIVHPNVGTAIANWLVMQSAIAGAPATLAAGSTNNPHIRFDPQNNGVVIIQLDNCPGYADDVAAAAGGVPLGGVYRTGSALKIRIA